ncbi:MAG: helix-turn-helix transcriptional regulator [Ruminococcus sp.]|nr:helix-turn-helix transcriptional regulator [Ruminococcus sp.]
MNDKEICKAIGKRIKQIRQNKGITQEKMAEMLELSSGFYSALERGNYNIKIETLVAILNLLECSADDLFCDVTKHGYKHKSSKIEESLKDLDDNEREMIFSVVETMVNTAKNNK